MFVSQRPVPNRRMSTSKTSTTGIIPSRRVNKVKPVEEYDSISELEALRKRTNQHLVPTCPQDVQEQIRQRIAAIDARILELTNPDSIALEVQRMTLIGYNQAGPSKPRTSPARWNTIPPSVTNGGGAGDPVSPLTTDVSPDGMNGLQSSSPTSPLFPIASKARIISQPLVTPTNKHRSNHSVQAMDLEETVRLEQDSLTQAMVLKHAEETRRAQRAALRPPSNAEARAMGLTEEEKKARIMAFMNFKGFSDDDEEEEEDDDDDDDDEEFSMQEKYGDFKRDSDDEMSDGDGDFDNTTYNEDMLSRYIQVDTSRISFKS